MGKLTTTAVAAVGLMLSVGLAACGSDAGPTDSAGFNAVEKGVVNPSDKKGGTLRYASSDDWDSPDMGDTYYAFSMNFGRLYARALTTFKPGPGSESLELVPDLAETLGTPSDGGRTWTYKIRKGVKYHDGTEVTAQDVKYAVERSNFTDELQLGPKYFKQYLLDNEPAYEGPYKDKSEEGLKSIETPDDHTIVFHLDQPFSEFDYLVQMQTQPVPRARDNGLEYQKNILATGPYKIDSYERGKSMKLSRNPHWDKSTDPIRTALPDTIEVALKQNADDMDKRLMAGALDMDLAGTGVQSAAQPTVLSSDQHKANADNITAGYLRYAAVNKNVAPLDDVHCRRAVAYATDKVAAQTAFGGPVAGGQIATTILPPSVTGHQQADRYPVGADQHGDHAKAKEELAACGRPDGFATKISARSDRPNEVAAAQGIQQGLAKVGIKTEIVQVPAGDYFNKYAGAPKWVHDEGVGIMLMAWAPDWPSGFGFLQQIVDGRAIKPSGGTNIQETDLPDVNKLFDAAIQDTDATARNARYTRIDQLVMEDAGIVPLIYAKLLLYRPPNVTNVTLNHGYGGMYDYLNLGVE